MDTAEAPDIRRATGYLFFLPIRKTTANPTVNMISAITRRKWASFAFSGMGTD